MVNFFLLLCVLTFSGKVLAESWLCVLDAASVLHESGDQVNGFFEDNPAILSSNKIILKKSEETGTWSLSSFGRGFISFCRSSSFCLSPLVDGHDDYVLFKRRGNRFSFFRYVKDESEIRHQISTGVCDKV